MNSMQSWIAALTLLAVGGSCSSSGKTNADFDEFVHLRVVDKASGEPAVGAQVFYLDRSKFDPRLWSAIGLAVLSPDEIRDAFCDSVFTDSAGKAQIPWSGDITGAEVRQGSKSGAVEFDPEKQETVVIQIEPNRVKHVSVVDARGNPVAGVPLLLIGLEKSPIPPARDSSSNRAQRTVDGAIGNSLLWYGRSHAPDGAVEVTDWRTIEKRVNGDARIRLCALADFADRSRRVDVRGDDQPTVITVPLPGVVVVKVRRADGAPAPRNTIVRLSSTPIHAAPASVKPGEKAVEDDGIFESRVTENGQAIFPAVWVGRMLNVTARTWDGSKGVEAEIEGPTAAGNTVVIELALGARLPTLTGRLVDEHGAPIPWTSFDIHWTSGKPKLGLNMDDAITDGTGRFRLDLEETPAVSAGEKPVLEVFARTVVARAGVVAVASEDMQVFATRASTARVSVTKPLTPGDIDLGDIELVLSKQ